MSLIERLESGGPKRILALEGGGIRGCVSLGFLEKIEQTLRDQHNNPDLKLCDYFDLIGGTSTGAVIAGALAIGMSASEIKQMYLDLGGRVFGKKKWKIWEAFFDAEPLKEELDKVFGNLLLGDDSINTGLCIITKRADTTSTWPLLNHPKAKYYGDNKDILLKNAIRASTAAPSYFVPEKFDVGKGEMGAFVDGGVSMHNNPSLQLLLVATLKGFPFHWKTGDKNLLIVSVGTGCWEERQDPDTVTDHKLWDWASKVPGMLLEDANWNNQIIMQFLSNTQTPWHIDSEIGDLYDDLLLPEPLLSYLRYNVRLEETYMNKLGLPDYSKDLDKIREMSEADMRFKMAEIGEKGAEMQVKPEHFPREFIVS